MRGVTSRFVSLQLMVAVVGGFSSTILFLAFAYTDAFRLVLYTLVLIIGTLVGLEIPLLMRILRDRFEFKDVVANVKLHFVPVRGGGAPPEARLSTTTPSSRPCFRV